MAVHREFSREPERARRNILYVRQRPSLLGIYPVGQWLWTVAERITGAGLAPEVYRNAAERLAHVLAVDIPYLEVIRETQKSLRKRVNFA